MEETARRSEFKDDLSIDAPIPGQSLTAPLGDRPWQNPPEYVEVEDALEYYIPKVLDPEFSVELLDIIEMGIPLTTIANSLQLASVMEGKHSVDIGMLILPILMEFIMLMADEVGIKYDNGMKKDKSIRESSIDLAISKLEEAGVTGLDFDKEEKEEPAEEEETKGLMARRKA